MRQSKLILLCALFLLAPSAAQTETKAPVKGAVLHTLEAEQTLGIVSRMYGASPEAIRALNSSKRLDTGVELWIPPSPRGWPVHLLLEGQTLSSVAKAYGISQEQLRQANPEAEFQPGQSLVLPRRRKPIWAAESVVPEPAAPKPRRALATSRSGKNAKAMPSLTEPSRPTTTWVEVRLADGRRGWVKTEELAFQPPKVSTPEESTSLPFGKKLSQSQKDAVAQMVIDLKDQGFTVRAEDIVIFMALETGGTFNPAIRSKGQANGAVGLAQFTSIAIQDMNRRRPAGDKLSKSRLAAMSFEEQSRVVTEYLATAFARKKMQGKVVTGPDLYCAIFAPRAIGTALNSTVYSRSRDPRAYHGNRSLDHNRDGRISKSELVVRLKDWTQRGEALRG